MIVIVTGMHRSGTSALAGLLHSNGIIMGDDQDFVFDDDPHYLKITREENPKGFYENSRFRSLNDLILSQNGYHVHRFSPYIPDNIVVSEQANDVMNQLLAEYSYRYPVWGFKDPRTCLTIDLWQKFFSKKKVDIKTVVINRRRQDVVASMQRRGDLGTLQQFKDLAMVYDQHIKQKAANITATINFETLIYKTKETAKYLSEKLEHPITDLSFIDSDLANRIQ